MCSAQSDPTSRARLPGAALTRFDTDGAAVRAVAAGAEGSAALVVHHEAPPGAPPRPGHGRGPGRGLGRLVHAEDGVTAAVTALEGIAG